jgi:hypothetical protein
MYNQGLIKFIQAKRLSSTQCINSFLISEGITNFSAKNHNRVNSYIETNWTKFASFVDKELKNGNLKGRAIKLNTYFDEQRERKEKVKDEYNSIELSIQQQQLLFRIRKEGIGFIQSFLMKNGIKPLPKDSSFTSKVLSWLPLVNQAIENDIIISNTYNEKTNNNK